MKINVTKSSQPDRQQFDQYINHIMESGWFTNNGNLVQELEQRLQSYLNVKNLVLVCNGTLALQIAYKALELKDEVITTPFTFIATASSLVWNGLDIVFADIDPCTFNISPNKIESAITQQTSAIVPVHVFGNPCDIEHIQEIAKKRNLKVIYDAAHAFGVKYKGKSILEWGDISIISFHATKIFHTIEGGALIIKDDLVYERVRKMINFGITGPESIECLGINARMNELQAAMGLTLLNQMNVIVKKREKLFHTYNTLLGDRIQRPRWNSHANNNYHYYPIVLDSEEQVKRVEKILRENNIFPRRYFYPSLDELDFLNTKSGEMKISRNIAHRILCLPFYETLKLSECKKICKIVLTAI